MGSEMCIRDRSGENVIFSETNNFFNFFRTTVRSLLDSDPIDVAVSQNEVSELKAAVPIQDSLLLFSELNQFTLSASQLLTPSEVTIDQSTKFECDLTAHPVGAGNSVFFGTTDGSYSGVREYFTQGDTEIKDATLITSHIPKYLKGKIKKMAASTNEDTLVCMTSTNAKELYIYKWYNTSQDRLQSSWSKWIFDRDVVNVFFNNATLYITFSDGSYEKLSIGAEEVDSIITISDTITGSNTGNFESVYISSGGIIAAGLSSNNRLRIDASQSFTQPNSMALNLSSSTRLLELQINTSWTYLSTWSHYSIGGLTLARTDATEGTGFIVGGTKKYDWTLTESQVNTLLANRDASGNLTHGWIVGGVGSSSLSTAASDFDPLLDHRVRLQAATLNGLFSSLTGLYTPTAFTQFVDYRGKLIATGNSSAELDKVYAALSNKTHFEDGVQVNDYIYAGEPYTFKYQLSEQVFKSGKDDPTRLARYQLRNITFNYNDTGAFTVNVDSTGRPTKTTDFTGRILGQEDNVLGYSAVVEEGSLKVGIQSQAKETSITIVNDSHQPSVFQNAEVEGFVVLRNSRI